MGYFSQVVYFSKRWYDGGFALLCVKEHIYLESLWRCGLFQFRFEFNTKKNFFPEKNLSPTPQRISLETRYTYLVVTRGENFMLNFKSNSQ